MVQNSRPIVFPGRRGQVDARIKEVIQDEEAIINQMMENERRAILFDLWLTRALGAFALLCFACIGFWLGRIM